MEEDMWLQSLMKADWDDESSDECESPKAQVRRVPKMLQHTKGFEKCFKPRVVSIGPYHHAKNEELDLMENRKKKLARRFRNEISRSPAKELYHNIFHMIQEVREFYEAGSTSDYDDKKLTQMMLVDGCFILYYIYCYVDHRLDNLKMTKYHVAFVRQDLFLLENQLPSQILEILMGSDIHKAMEKINKFIGILNFETDQEESKRNKLPPLFLTERRSHLLELLQNRLIGNPLRVRRKKNRYPSDRRNEIERDGWHSFRNVSELTAVGIQLQPSGTNFLDDVSFESHFIYGDLKLPPIRVDDSSKAKFMNLIAYEMSPDVVNNFEVTSYICFLDSLIDHPEDVKALRAAGILHNFLGSDEEVAKLFNEIRSDWMPDIDLYEDPYKEVKADIQKHYDNSWKTGMAQFRYDHFNHHWSGIVSVAAIIAFIITGLATYYTIFPPPSDCEGFCNYLKSRHLP